MKKKCNYKAKCSCNQYAMMLTNIGKVENGYEFINIL